MSKESIKWCKPLLRVRHRSNPFLRWLYRTWHKVRRQEAGRTHQWSITATATEITVEAVGNFLCCALPGTCTKSNRFFFEGWRRGGTNKFSAPVKENVYHKRVYLRVGRKLAVHRHDESGRAVATLTRVALHHRFLSQCTTPHSLERRRSECSECDWHVCCMKTKRINHKLERKRWEKSC